MGLVRDPTGPRAGRGAVEATTVALATMAASPGRSRAGEGGREERPAAAASGLPAAHTSATEHADGACGRAGGGGPRSACWAGASGSPRAMRK